MDLALVDEFIKLDYIPLLIYKFQSMLGLYKHSRDSWI